MSLTLADIKKQTRDLWDLCFDCSEEFKDIFFEDKYNDRNNLTIRSNNKVVSALQLISYRMTFYGSVHRSAYLTGLATHPDFRSKGYATNLIREAHRRLFESAATLSFLIPKNDEERKFFESPQHGGYHTSTFRKEMALDVTNDGKFDKIEVSRPDEWPVELYHYYHRLTMELPFMFHPSEEDFFAALEAADLQDGFVLVARRKQRLVGFCLAVKEPNGKVYIRTLAISEAATRAAFVDYLCRECGVTEVYRRFCLPGSVKETEPYAMARVINVPLFLEAIARPNPGFQLHIGIEGDVDIPENNGWYIVENGHVRPTDIKPDNIVTPGGLVAMFMAAQPIVMDLLLDE